MAYPLSARSSVLLVALLTSLGVSLLACDDDDDDGPNNGVDDVKAACEIRATWTAPTSNRCLSCMAVAPQAPCGCEAFEGFDGVCHAQGQAVRAEPSCTESITTCVRDCASDCACVDGCYAAAEACKKVNAALDGCVADACSAYCNE